MNALRPLLSRNFTRLGSKRLATTLPRPEPPLPPQYKYNLKKAWLSDPATYPILVVMGCAMTFMVGMTLNGMLNYTDVQFDPKKRNTMVRNWGKDDYNCLTKQAVYWNSYQKNMPEGLGVDHAKWVQQKKDYADKE